MMSMRRQEVPNGYTLIEMMIALAIGTAIMLALMLMFSSNSGNQQELERTVRQIENARFSLDVLTEDIVHAGFFSGFSPTALEAAPAYTTPDPCDKRVSKVTAADPAPQGWDTTVDPVQLPVPVEGIRAATAVACLDNRLASTEAIVIRRAEISPTVPWPANDKNLYIEVSRCNPALLVSERVLRVSSVPPAKPEEILHQPDCSTPNNAVRRLLQRTYYIASCNDCATNDRIPTLKRVEVIDGEPHITSIAEGVENLQFEFGVDFQSPPPGAGQPPGPPDGVPDVWRNTVDMTNADWPDVVSVRVHLLTRATQSTPGYVETRTYQLGPVTLKPEKLEKDPKNGSDFKRTLLSSTVRLNNVGGRRER